MEPSDVIRALDDPNPGFICSNALDSDSPARYRVPLTHVRFSACRLPPDTESGRLAQQALPDIPSVRQLLALTRDAHGLGLWASKRLIEKRSRGERLTADEYADCVGSLLIFPPNEWEHLLTEFADWQYDGVESAFDGLPYGFGDIIPFAGLNYSPDRWLLVLRGPMAGKVCWWSHDGETCMDMPWADDLRAWADRVFADPQDETVSALVRFTAADSIDPAPPDAQLVPDSYEASMP